LADYCLPMSSFVRPLLEVVAGPNGSGKSTFAESYLVRILNRTSYLNPDIIAAGISPSDAQQGSFQAGRILLREIKNRLENREELGFETTLSGLTYLNTLKIARANGYFVRIYFVFTSNPKTNILRIKKRVQMGGHHISSRDVLRRYKRSFENFWNLYRNQAEDWVLFDNSGGKPIFVYSKETFEALDASAQAVFEKSFLKGRVIYA
jgi:predicted ABC-type ATPase